MTQLEVHSLERIYLRQRSFDASKPRVAVSTDPQYQYACIGFPDVIQFRVAVGERNPVPASEL